LKAPPVSVPVVPIAQAARALAARAPVTSFHVKGLSPVDMTRAWQGMQRFEKETRPEEQLRYAMEVYRLGSGEKRGLNSDGIIRRNVTDQKVYLHWRRDTEDLLRLMRGIELAPWQREWFESCRRIHDACLASYRKVIAALDDLHPQYRLLERLDAATAVGMHVLRVLYYPPRSGLLADDHVDWSPFTLHVGESAPGLFGFEEGEKVYYETPDPGNVIGFVGEQLAWITRNHFPALYHGVDDTTGGTSPRWAMVFFGKMVDFEKLY
jgi:hypothetical protein